MEAEEILYIHYHQDLLEQQRFKSLFKALGVLWNKTDLDSKKNDDAADESDEIFIPLSMVINPKILDLVKQNRKSTPKNRTLADGTAIDPALGPVMSLADLPKEDFYKMIGQQMPSKLPDSAKKELKKRWVTDKK